MVQGLDGIMCMFSCPAGNLLLALYEIALHMTGSAEMDASFGSLVLANL
jgi:hypothetical protein